MSFGIKVSYMASFLLLVSFCNGQARDKPKVHPQGGVYLAALYNAETQGIEDNYIVVLHPGTNVRNHLKSIYTLLTSKDKILANFSIQQLTGYGAMLTKKTLHKLRTKKEVQYIEQNTIPNPESCTEQISALWGLRRISTRDLPLENTYKYLNTGEGVVVYIIDSGIDETHPDFEGRVSWGYDYENPTPQDPNHQKPRSDHGTHVAGIAISKTYGVAKQAKAVALKYDSTLDVILAIEFAVNNHAKDSNPRKRRAVINMSLGVSRDNALNSAVDDAVSAGLVVVVAAGNQDVDACTQSPGSASKAITVMNSQIDDTRRPTSNFGDCAHLYAPGTNILSTLPNNGDGTKTGTSMAAPHVAGVVARYLSSFPPDQQPTPAEVKRWLLDSALPKVKVSGKLYKLLHYNDCVSRSTWRKNF